MKKSTIVIIGAGSTGLSTALSLAQSSTHKIIVLEQNHVGSGQTGQCCGFVRTFYNAPEMITSAGYSMKAIKDVCKKNKDLEYVKKGLLVIDDLKNAKSVSENVKLLQAQGVKAKYLEQDSLKTLNPYLVTEGICAGFDENAGYVNPQLMVNYLESQCRQYGVEIHENEKVTNIETRGNKFYIQTDKDQVVGDKVFNATAAYTNKINHMLGVELPIKVIKINNGFYRLPMGPQKYLVALADFVNGFYLIPHADFIDVSTVILDLNESIDPETEEYKLKHEIIQEYLDLISKRIQGANKSAILGGFSSCIDISPDYYPIISKIDEVPNYYVATGFSGTGFKHFPMISKLMTELILETNPSYPELISFFRYNRFDKDGLRKKVSDSYFVKE